MNEIIVKETKDMISLTFLRVVFCFLLVVLAISELSGTEIDIHSSIAIILILLVYAEIKAILPSQMTKIINSGNEIVFIYEKKPFMAMTISLPIDGEIKIRNDFWSSRTKVVSGNNAVLLPWPINTSIENDIKKAINGDL